MNESQELRIIRPDSRSSESTFTALRHLVHEIWRFRSHIRIVFRQQFHAAYSGTGLGVFWNFALPLVPLTVYMLLGALHVFPSFDGVDSLTYRAFGITLWFLLAGFVQSPINVINSRNKEVMKTAFPLSAAIVSGYASLLFDTLVRIGFVILVVVYTQSWPHWSALLLPFVLLPAAILFAGLGLLLGILNVIYNDVGRVVTILLTYGIFLSGVIFPLPQAGVLATINMFNPFATFIDAARHIVFLGSIGNLAVIGVTAVLGVILFLLGSRVFYVMEYRIRGIN